MGANGYIELEEFITRERVEWAHREANKAHERGRQGFAQVGLKAAKRRDDKMLKVLDIAANILHQMSEEQMGQTRRMAVNSEYNSRLAAEHTEVAMWREAYRLMDEGKIEPWAKNHPLEWIYGAAALLCGYNL
jgi:hypothetical protein